MGVLPEETNSHNAFLKNNIAQPTSVGLSQRRHHHRGPLLGFTVTAEVEGDGVAWWGGETHLMATGRFHLILHRAEVKLCNELWRKKKDKFYAH